MLLRGKTVNTEMCRHGKMSLCGRERGILHKLVSSWNFYNRYLFIVHLMYNYNQSIHITFIIPSYCLFLSSIHTSRLSEFWSSLHLQRPRQTKEPFNASSRTVDTKRSNTSYFFSKIINTKGSLKGACSGFQLKNFLFYFSKFYIHDA